MVRLVCGVKKRSRDILRLEEWVVAKNLVMRRTGSKELKQIHHSKTRAANARTPATFAGFHCDAFEQLHDGRLHLKCGFFQQEFKPAYCADARVT